MTPTKAMTRHCEATTRSGGTCRRPAGWGTPHPRRGRCKLHGGCTPAQVAHEEQAAAIDFARGALGAEVSDDPLEAMLQSVRLASGIVAYWRQKLAKIEAPSRVDEEGFARALLTLQRVAKAAIDAGVTDRLAAITDRAADQVVFAAEEALGALTLSLDERSRFVATFANALRHAENAPIDG
jgi:hypothetical protein